MAGLAWPKGRGIGNEVRGEKGEGGDQLYKNLYAIMRILALI